MTRTVFPISRERHGQKKWLRAKDLRFAAGATVTPVNISEMLAAARSFPLGFIDIGGKSGLACVMGLKPGQNVFVGANGRWLAQHVPVNFQHFPFSLGLANDQTMALCIDEASGLMVDNAVGEEGFPFFGPDGSATAETANVLQGLVSARTGFEVVERATAEIVARGLLEAWPINYKENGEDRRIEGIKRINEAALNGLSADDLLALRNSGGLAIAYCQLFSMGNIASIGQLFQAHAAATKQRMTIPEHSFLPQEDDSLKIDWDSFLKDR